MESMGGTGMTIWISTTLRRGMRVIIGSCVGLAGLTVTGQVYADGPVPVELVEARHAPSCFRMRAVSVHAADGEPIPIESAEGVAYDPALMSMTVDQAMTRLAELSQNTRPFADESQPENIAKEFACLNAIVALKDTGGEKSLAALHQLLRGYEALGGDPLDWGYWRPMSRVSGFAAAPVLLAPHLREQPLSAVSAAFLEKTYRKEMAQAIRDPQFGRIFSYQTAAGSVHTERFYIQLLKNIITSGFASDKFLSWVRDEYLRLLPDALLVAFDENFLRHQDIRMLAHLGALDRKELRRMLNIVAEAMLLAPKQVRYKVVLLIGEISRFAEFEPNDAVRLLGLLAEARRLDESWSRSERDVVTFMLARFEFDQLWPTGDVPAWMTKYGPRRRRRPDAALPDEAHVRVSRVRLAREGSPSVLESFTSPVTGGTWKMFRCGREEGSGLLGVHYASRELAWSFHTGTDFEYDSSLSLSGDRPAVRRLLRTHIYTKPWDDIWKNDVVPVFDAWFAEFAATPFSQQQPSPPELINLIAETVPKDVLLSLVALNWMRARTDLDLRDQLLMICKTDDGDMNYRAVKAARILIEREDWSALDGLIPDLLEFHQCLPTPVMEIFFALAEDETIARARKKAWGRGVVRKLLNGPMAEWKTKAVMEVVTSLAEDSFGFDKRGTAQANMEAFAKAQHWAWPP